MWPKDGPRQNCQNWVLTKTTSPLSQKRKRDRSSFATKDEATRFVHLPCSLLLSLLISFGNSHYVTLFFLLIFFYMYLSFLSCFFKTTLTICYTLSLSQAQVHNASQTMGATLDRQDTQKEDSLVSLHDTFEACFADLRPVWSQKDLLGIRGDVVV